MCEMPTAGLALLEMELVLSWSHSYFILTVLWVDIVIPFCE